MAVKYANIENLALKLRVWEDAKRLSWGLIGVGIILRLVYYLADRSLWLDEARLALNIVNRSFAQLLQPLDYVQGAPIGFLMVEKLVVQLFGNNEYALRLFPFLCGLISLVLFYRLAIQSFDTKVVLLALSLFVFSRYLIEYSAEVKQYSSDVAVALLLYLMTINMPSEKLTLRPALFLGVVGAIALWFSHPALFILAGMGIMLILPCLIRGDWVRVGSLFVVFLLWGISFALLYFVSLQDLGRNEALLDYWAGSFMPLPPTSFSDITWFINTFFGIFENPGGLPLTGLAAFTFLLGGLAFWREKKEQFFILSLPILLALLASGLQGYPFKGRLLLFAVPMMLLFIAAGIKQILSQTQNRAVMIGFILIGLLFIHPLLFTVRNLVNMPGKEEIKPVMSYVKTHQQAEDILYLYYGAAEAFKYYQQQYGYQDGDYLVGAYSREDWAKYAQELDQLQGQRRVWILFSHSDDVEGKRNFSYTIWIRWEPELTPLRLKMPPFIFMT
ncbi:MAG: glycosyltransferase family 39 protein [Anaerolineae bacterium]|nr:glycosyltransferase family 39 protein [Anaerolineae bacterium]